MKPPWDYVRGVVLSTADMKVEEIDGSPVQLFNDGLPLPLGAGTGVVGEEGAGESGLELPKHHFACCTSETVVVAGGVPTTYHLVKGLRTSPKTSRWWWLSGRCCCRDSCCRLYTAHPRMNGYPKP